MNMNIELNNRTIFIKLIEHMSETDTQPPQISHL